MLDLVKTIITGQFEAAMCMFDQCVRACPPQHWEGRIASGTFRWVAYHTLFWTDLYLSPGGEDDFELRDLHHKGGDERKDEPAIGLGKDDTIEYIAICHRKMLDTLAAESAASLAAPCAFPQRRITRGELHLYNLRHVQHHTGQMSAYLRRVDPTLSDPKALRWVSTGWRS